MVRQHLYEGLAGLLISQMVVCGKVRRGHVIDYIIILYCFGKVVSRHLLGLLPKFHFSLLYLLPLLDHVLKSTKKTIRVSVLYINGFV
jgi:hypothetical protein